MRASSATALVVAALVAPVASAATTTRARTTVTIETKNGDFWGEISSSRPRKCAAGRTVVVYKQIGTSPSPSSDPRIASDTASWSGSAYEWSTGTTGRSSGRYYAHVRRTPDCRAATSQTVRASKP